METTQLKICSKCKIEKSITEFGKLKSAKDGLKYSCKECRKIEYLKNKESILLKNKIKYELNKEKILNKSKEYYNQNKQKIADRNKIYYEANKEKIRESSRITKSIYYQNHKDEISKRHKEYGKTEKGRLINRNKHLKRRYKVKKGDATTSQIEELISNTRVCYWCKCKLSKKSKDIHIDHYIPLSRGGDHTIGNLVTTCPTCNLKKNAKDPLKFANELGRLL